MRQLKNSEKMPLSRNDGLVIQEVDQEVLIYDLETNKAICLNPTAKFVWQHCDHKTSIHEVTKKLSGKFDSKITGDVVRLALNELKKANLLEKETVSIGAEEKVSRRDLVVKYGVPMAVLPIIMSLVAPTSAQTGSCIASGQPCTSGGTPCCGDFTFCNGSVCVTE